LKNFIAVSFLYESIKIMSVDDEAAEELFLKLARKLKTFNYLKEALKQSFIQYFLTFLSLRYFIILYLLSFKQKNQLFLF
jgi:hypothetical protein